MKLLNYKIIVPILFLLFCSLISFFFIGGLLSTSSKDLSLRILNQSKDTQRSCILNITCNHSYTIRVSQNNIIVPGKINLIGLNLIYLLLEQ